MTDMKKRIVEMLAAGIGVMLVVVFYLSNREAETSRPEPGLSETTPEALSGAAAPFTGAMPVAAPATPDDREVVAAQSIPVGSARADLEAARREQKVVRAALEELDVAFDARDVEFSARKARGEDPDALREEMLIYLDDMVERYDELEARLAAAERQEQAASERLTALAGTRRQPGGSS